VMLLNNLQFTKLQRMALYYTCQVKQGILADREQAVNFSL